MQSKSYLFLGFVLALTALSVVLYISRPYRFGLDVEGGIRIVYQMDTAQLKPEQRQNLGLVRQNLVRVLTQRAAGALGVVEAPVQQKGTDQFVVELPGFTDTALAEQVLGSTASIQFYHAKTVNTPISPNRQYEIDTEAMDPKNPAVVFHLTSNATKVIRPGTPEYLAMIQSWGAPILEGDDLARAELQVVGTMTQPLMIFSGPGARKMEEFTRRYYNRQENLAAVLDNRVLSIAHIQKDTILKDHAIIEGQFDPVYVQNLVKLLNAGALPVTLNKLSLSTVDPTIGKTALKDIVLAGAISFGVIAAFLLVYYVFPGIVATIALALYILFTLTALKWINATFSLAAIAGFILSVGMAVDANILVFERVKEELRHGRHLLAAIELGFKRALPAIVDSNTCTILTSLVLVNLGTGPVKGFATTLIIGVLISLFTAITVTRSLLMFLVGSGLGANPKWYGLNRQWFGEGMELESDKKPLQIVENTKRWFAISLLTILPGIVFIALGGLKLNVEFKGGFEVGYVVPATGGPSQNQVLANLAKAGFSGSNVKFGMAEKERIMYVTVPVLPGMKADEAAAQRIAEAVGLPRTAQRTFSYIGPSVQAETRNNAILGVVISSLLIVVYLAIRFGMALGGFANGLRFGLSAIGAMVHDILVVIGVAAIFGYISGWEVSALFITAMLTMIGFSVHDTIVIFDRIRENLRRPHPGENFGHLVDRSVTQSFARSINTSGTVIVTLIILIIWGTPTPDLKFFCVIMLTGIISGTYSSIYNAAPILWLWDRAAGRKRGKEGTLMEEAEMAYKEALRIRAEVESVGGPGDSPRTVRDQQGRSYGQVKRRSSVIEKAQRPMDEE